jgi:hypothetical protein
VNDIFDTSDDEMYNHFMFKWLNTSRCIDLSFLREEVRSQVEKTGSVKDATRQRLISANDIMNLARKDFRKRRMEELSKVAKNRAMVDEFGNIHPLTKGPSSREEFCTCSHPVPHKKMSDNDEMYCTCHKDRYAMCTCEDSD